MRTQWRLLLCLWASLLVHDATAGPFERGMEFMERGDFAEAFCLWRPLAGRGHAEAAYHLGWLYANGNGLKVDIDQAVHWWSEAAARGHIEAQFALGLTYTTGEGIKADADKALDWYLRAADGGHEDAREMVRTKVVAGTPEVKARLSEVIAKPWLGRPVRVVADGVNLRAGPGTGYKMVGKVNKGSLLKVIGEQDKWLRVLGSDDQGALRWIAGWLTEPVE